MQSHSLIKGVLITKLVIVTAALFVHKGWIQLGDRALFAEASDPETKDEGQKNIKTSPEEGLEDEVEVNETNARKSFLSGLFELPKLNAKKVKKAEIGKYLDMAERKEQQISERTIKLAKREEQLKALERSIEEKLSQLDDERKFIAKTLQEEKDLKGERLDKVVELYDKMDPKKAAVAFEKIDKDLAVALLKRLKQKQVTTILEAMNPEKSVELTEYFARVKSAKEYDLLKELNDSLKKEFQDCKGMPVAAAGPEKIEKPSAASSPDKANNTGMPPDAKN